MRVTIEFDSQCPDDFEKLKKLNSLLDMPRPGCVADELPPESATNPISTESVAKSDSNGGSESEPSESPADVLKAVTFNDLRSLVTQALDLRLVTRDKLRELFKAHGASKLSELVEDRYASFASDLEGVTGTGLNGEEAEL